MKFLFSALVLLLPACNYNHVKAASDKSEIGQDKLDNPDFATVMSAVVGPKCLFCHSNSGGNKGATNLENYAAIRAVINRVYYRSVEARDMPPGSPLSAREGQLLKRWVETGSPEFVVGIGEKPGQDIEQGVTNWAKIKDKIFAVKCLDCHQPPTPMGGVDLSEVALVRGLAPRIFESVIVKSSMPIAPYPAMTPVERRVLLKWFDLGMPEK